MFWLGVYSTKATLNIIKRQRENSKLLHGKEATFDLDPK
jgi:hypothetical protein